KVEPKPGVDVADPEPGLRFAVKKGLFESVPSFDDVTDAAWRPCEGPRLFGELLGEKIAARFVGYLKIDAPGLYECELTSDDGAKLTLAGQLVVDNDGLHGAVSKRGCVALGKGLHALQVDWFNATGSRALELKVGRLGERPQVVPAGA